MVHHDNKGVFEGLSNPFEATRYWYDLDGTNQSIAVPTLVLHGGDDQIVPVADSAPLSAKLLKNSTLKIHEGLPHGICTTHASIVNAELSAFIAA